MSSGYRVYCLGASEVEFDKNGNLNQRDIKCHRLKFEMMPPEENNWTCWPCLDFLKKFDQKVWLDRKRIEFFQTKARRSKKPSYWNMRIMPTKDRKNQPKI